VYPNLKLQLWKSGIRQNRLARLLGVDETVLSRIMNGFREPNQDLQNHIAAVLKCDAAWLFSREDRFAVPAAAGVPEASSESVPTPVAVELGPPQIEKAG
jgi:transcriptional regulator with XRE-family HTH domain